MTLGRTHARTHTHTHTPHTRYNNSVGQYTVHTIKCPHHLINRTRDAASCWHVPARCTGGSGASGASGANGAWGCKSQQLIVARRGNCARALSRAGSKSSGWPWHRRAGRKLPGGVVSVLFGPAYPHGPLHKPWLALMIFCPLIDCFFEKVYTCVFSACC